MITTIEPGRYFHVIAQNQSQIQDELNTAVESARAHASMEGWLGILVTRHSPETYTVALSPSVPYGLTIERDDWAPADINSSL